MIMICKERNCTGCFACENICTHNAIKMIYSTEGFLYPVISNDLCVECGACRKVCPVVNNRIVLNTPIKAYKGSSKDVELLKESTSGAVFSELAKVVLAENGAVFGAVMTDSLQVKHVVAESMTDIADFRGSKYIGSNLSGIYKEVLLRLQKGQKVLFSGTPCQVAALYGFLGGGYMNS